MVRYYCSGFDRENAFGHGLGEMFKKELKGHKNIVYIPNKTEKMEITYESLSAENHQKKVKAPGMETLYHPVGNHLFPARVHPCADHGGNAHRGL